MIKQWLQRRRERKEKAVLDLKAKEASLLEKNKQKLKDKTAEMLSSPCAINNMENCEGTCVHFREGYLGKLPGDDTELGVYHYVQYPTCKLWR